MSVSLESLGIDRLSVKERLDLIDKIGDSLPESVDPNEVPGLHLDLLRKRRAEALSRPGEGRPWREVLDAFSERETK